jgi:transposase
MKKNQKGLCVADIKRKYKEQVYHTYLLRRSYREDGKVKQQTLANLTPLPDETREIIRGSLQGRVFVPLEEAIEITRSRSHGHVAAVRKMFQHLGLAELICAQPCRERDLVEAMIVARILNPQTKLATTRWWHNTTLPEELSVADADEDELYAAMDWLVQRQANIESKLAQRHLGKESLVLYDVSSSYYEGSHCALAAYGHNRDKKKGKKQIVYGLMTDDEGRPISIQVYPGFTSDPNTADDQINKLKIRFGVEHFVLAGDRGMLTQGRIDKLKELGGIDWVSALRAPSIKRLVEQGNLQLSLFDEKDLMEITSPDYPGERLVVCRNPYLAEDRARTRRELLAATEEKLAGLAKRVAAGRLKQEAKIGEALGRVATKYKMAKHFAFTVGEGRFSYKRNEEGIAAEAALDGFYVIRTSVAEEKWSPEKVVLSYKSLSRAERAFRTLKGVDLKIRPIHHRMEGRVRAHIFLCMLAYYVEWHLREAWRSLLFDDEYPGEREAGSPVLPAWRSASALKKASTKILPDGTPVHSFQTLLSELAMIVCNDAWVPAIPEIPPFTLITKPNQTQGKALEFTGLDMNPKNSRQKKLLKSAK